jgi:hypothetical protein
MSLSHCSVVEHDRFTLFYYFTLFTKFTSKFLKTMKLFLCALFLASAIPMASAACPAKGVVTTFTGACTLANIEQQLSCTLSTIGFAADAVKKACDASA